MITDKEDAIFNLIMNQNMLIIRELFAMSYFSDDLFMAVLRKFKPFQIYAEFADGIIDLVTEHFGHAVWTANKCVIDTFLQCIASSDVAMYSKCFIKLVDLGGTVGDDYNFVTQCISRDAFYYYVSLHKININQWTLLSCLTSGDCDIRDWIFAHWESSDVKYNDDMLVRFVSGALFDESKKYFARFMHKIGGHKNFDEIILCAMIECVYVDDISYVTSHVADYEYIEELRMLEIIRHVIPNHPIYRLQNPNRFVREKNKMTQLLESDDTAQSLFVEIVAEIKWAHVNHCDKFIKKLTLFLDKFNSARMQDY